MSDHIPVHGSLGDLPVERFERLERAILGDPQVGHLGAIERLNQVDELHHRVPEVHREMEEARVAGDRRAHERIDALDEKHDIDAKRIERKIDRLWWMLIGSGGAGFIAGWAVAGAPPLG